MSLHPRLVAGTAAVFAAAAMLTDLLPEPTTCSETPGFTFCASESAAEPPRADEPSVPIYHVDDVSLVSAVASGSSGVTGTAAGVQRPQTLSAVGIFTHHDLLPKA